MLCLGTNSGTEPQPVSRGERLIMRRTNNGVGTLCNTGQNIADIRKIRLGLNVMIESVSVRREKGRLSSGNILSHEG